MYKPALINTLVFAPMTQGTKTQSYADEIKQCEQAMARNDNDTQGLNSNEIKKDKGIKCRHAL